MLTQMEVSEKNSDARYLLVAAMVLLSSFRFDLPLFDGGLRIGFQWIFLFLALWYVRISDYRTMATVLFAGTLAAAYASPIFGGLQFGGLDLSIVLAAILVIHVWKNLDRSELIAGSAVFWAAILFVGLWNARLAASGPFGLLGFWMTGDKLLFCTVFLLGLVAHPRGRSFVHAVLAVSLICVLAYPWLGRTGVEEYLDSGVRLSVFLAPAQITLIDLLAVYLFFVLGRYSRTIFFSNEPRPRLDPRLLGLVLLLVILINQRSLSLRPANELEPLFILSEWELNYIICIWLGLTFGTGGIIAALAIAIVAPLANSLLLPPFDREIGQFVGTLWNLRGGGSPSLSAALSEALMAAMELGICALAGDEIRRQLRKHRDGSSTQAVPGI